MDLEALVRGELLQVEDVFTLEYFHVSTGNNTLPTATVRVKNGSRVLQEAACGDGPVDALYRAIERITGLQGTLKEYSIKAVTGGKDALGEVTIRMEYGGKSYTGRGVSTDVIAASARAYMNAVNKIARENQANQGKA